MTRINVGVPPKNLCRQHLIAELREIVRIPNLVKTRINIKKQPIKSGEIPKEFKLGTGHVKFFYDKINYLKLRYERLYQEARSRGYNVQNMIDAFNNIPEEFMGDYFVTPEAQKLIEDRIKERLSTMTSKPDFSQSKSNQEDYVSI